MARTILTAVLVVLLTVLVGCTPVDGGRGRIMPPRTGAWSRSPTVVSEAGEGDAVEQVTANRQAYREALLALIRYYRNTGNHMKLTWAEKEFAALNTMPQYKYIVEASMAGPNLKAIDPIVEADNLYWEARELERKAGILPIKNTTQLRRALDKYNELISKYPSSDKIDDAAYQAGKIYEHFKDYTIALLYYQRTHQWDPHTPHPARFREARILDQRLHERAKALRAYQAAMESITLEGQHHNWEKYAKKRIAQLTKSAEGR
ncbi:MAG: tetratricopeptide repeat protein [Planctomycetota bacterium]